MGILGFIGDLASAPIANLLDCDWKTVSTGSGAYLLLAGPGTKFVYPAGQSPVFYIGQATGLHGRLNRHRQEIQGVRNRRRHCIYTPLLEYGSAFGTRFSYVVAAPKQRPKDLEDELMARFAERYHSLPVANGAGAWARLRKIIDRMT
jgi:hypothetical protein